ncbi:MAG: hypothetical protein C0613_06890 [Desulfobulbaceae bacterium]|nr:MAG: hypothetical protein C0613_06890 [Desulfobulbaceae bacterium]
MHDGVSHFLVSMVAMWPQRAAAQEGSDQLAKKGADFSLVKDDGAVSFFPCLQAGDHPDAGLQGEPWLQGDIKPLNLKIGKLRSKGGKRPACQVAARSENGVVKDYLLHVIF